MTKEIFLAPSGRIPVNNIYCIGRNYAAHARELGNVVEEKPVVFLKPNSALITENETIQLPTFSNDVHHEVELVALIGTGGKNISEASALDHIAGYAIGLDLTARDVQSDAKKKGLPWAVAKGFDTSACVSSFVEASSIADVQQLVFSLEVNGEMRQRGETAHMIFSMATLVSYLSSIFTLQHGDLIFTGTPEGVARIAHGDRLALSLERKLSATFVVG